MRKLRSGVGYWLTALRPPPFELGFLQMRIYATLAASAAVLALSAPAFAQSSSTIVQEGDQNVVTVDQQNANSVVINQIGNMNSLDADQTGNNNVGTVDQIASNNSAFLRQFGLNSTGTISQVDGAVDNNAVITQGARTDGSLATITQTGIDGGGDNNSAVAAQEGSMTTTILQVGSNSGADSRSEGDGTLSDIFQAGGNNSAIVRQFSGADNSSSFVIQGDFGGGSNLATANQNGSIGSFSAVAQSAGTGNTTTLFQRGDDNTSFIDQGFADGDDNDATVNQDGDSNTNTINQNLLVTGGTNSALVNQFSDGNTSTLNQEGSNNSATVTQGSAPPPVAM